MSRAIPVNMWLLLASYVCSSICNVLCQIDPVPEPRVTISQGVVVGSAATDGSYLEFYGIPYADSTSGINRFKAPSEPPIFRDEFIANRKNIKCVRALGRGYEGTEDCLAVDVLTPSLNNINPLPVMVWIKGQELETDNNIDVSFKRFLEKDVVIVRMNYRESVLGFLCLGTESAPGNAGLKDIIAGLRWIQQNIAAFGGDPDNITLFGHGSGAAAVDLVTLSPLAEGLVHKVIAQSGSALSPWAVTRNNLKYAIEVAEALGHNVTNIDTLSDVFSRTSVAALMAVINELDLTDNSLAFAPCIERRIENVEPLLLKSPYTTIMEGEQLQIPFMTGFVDIEGTMRANEIINNDWLEKMDNNFVDFLQPDLEFQTPEQEGQTAEEIKNYYFENNSNAENRVNDFLLYSGDTMILVSAIREARMRAASSHSFVYLYQFSYKGHLSETFLERPLPIESAGHKEELIYMFHNDENTDVSILDLTIGDILIERWTNFAKNGQPSSETSQVVWQPYDLTNNYYLRILDDQEMGDNGSSDLDVELENPQPETVRFWDYVYTRFFADATSRWTLDDRTVEDEEIVDEGEGEDDNNEGSGGENGSEDGDNNEGSGGESIENENDKEGGGNSASTLVGYTFITFSIFSILNKFHATDVL